MSDYTFDSLNDKEFEILVNRLLSRRESVEVERFKPGRDGGIDGRFFSSDGGCTIVQSKHWLKSGMSKLLKHLEVVELPKVKSLNPDRYVIATSLPLSPNDVAKIVSIFNPYIVSEADVLGQERLNDLLTTYPEIEVDTYKLWIKSVSVLSNIMHQAIVGRSAFLRDEIVDEIGRFVRTSAFAEARTKLEELHTVIVTGEAGVGKTTLAKQLAHFCMAAGYELTVIENSINEAEDVLQQDKKQVFFFDDFLGQNYFEALSKHEDSHIMTFMRRVERNPDKRFILTSRTTILNRGKALGDKFSEHKLDKREYEVAIEALSDIEKAKILYNHLWYGNLPEQFIQECSRSGLMAQD